MFFGGEISPLQCNVRFAIDVTTEKSDY